MRSTRTFILLSMVLFSSRIGFSQTSRFFWTTDDAIGSAWGDGSHATYLLTGLNAVMGIAVDSTSNPPMIYFAERGADRIMKARYDGTDTVAVVTGVSGAMDLELDLVHRKIYWMQNSWNDDRVQRADMDGLNSNVEDLYKSTSTQYDFNGLAIDVTNQLVFWTQAEGAGYDKLCRMNWNKTGYQILFDLYTGMAGNPWDVDVVGDRIYWTDPSITGSGVYSAKEDGTDVDTVFASLHTHFFVIDPAGGKIYWTMSGGIGSANLDGSDSCLFIGGLAYGMNAIAFCPGNIPAEGVGGKEPLPVTFSLEQNFPNPFNPTTIIRYSIPVETYCNTSLRVYDILGREVAVLVNERKSPGSYEVRFEGGSLASGVYLYKLTAGSFVQTRRMLLLR